MIMYHKYIHFLPPAKPLADCTHLERSWVRLEPKKFRELNLARKQLGDFAQEPG